ncbi:MAG: 2-oxo acid dehydrogenase subunit [Solirubrobacterales bacterium]|nr:2-oxo acid dehydrogenase subunit [Solirubrobacterales bacterium]
MSSSHTETALVDVTMPQMGVSVAEGTVVEWKRQVGEEIAADDTICEISTDKIDTEVPAPVSGTVAEILVDVGTTVTVGTVLARIGVAGAGAAPAPRPAPEAETAGEVEPVPKPAVAAANGNGARSPRGRFSPVVLRIAAQHDVDLDQVTGTGRGGRVRKQDVLAHVEQRDAGPEPPLHIESPYRPDTVPTGAGLSRMRRQIGEHMKRSLDTAATCTTWMEADVTRVERARRELGLTALPLVARATIEALREFPALNATLDGDAYAQHPDVNLGIAVSLGDDGLIVPVIQRAQELSPEGLGARIKDLARRARAKQLTPDDVRGGTFTITNPGQFGSIMATPVINQPQVAILDLEAVVKRPVVVTDADGNDSIAIRSMTILGLSWDHRALDGVLAAQFLAALKRRLECHGE